LVLHVALWLPITLLGAFYLAKEGIKWGDDVTSLQVSNDEESYGVNPHG